ncbi:M24 family metallopeptidase, partial [Candidatus Woesearchaeota archaeon]|nr:M24 family metallopeptidase [Candidatus Woesearchaeota archaeon]
AISDSVFFELLQKIKAFKTEKETAEWITRKIEEKNCENAFNPIVATGRNAEKPHHEPTNEMNKGFCVIDFGAKYEGYCSDLTRTIYFGKPLPSERTEYNKVMQAQQTALSTVKTGISMKDINKKTKKQLGKQFIHSIGHGVGIEIHEHADKLKENMTITIEPGIYGKERGIRIEDTIIVTKKGCETLTKSTKKLIHII